MHGRSRGVEFYKTAFGAVEVMRLPGKDGKLMHAAIQIGGATLMLVDEMPEWGALSPKSLNGTPVTIHLYVSDVDAFFDRAVKAGARAKMPVADMFWGRPLRRSRRSVRPQLVGRHAAARGDTGRDPGSTEGHAAVRRGQAAALGRW